MKVAFYAPTASGGHARFTQCLMEGVKLAAPGLELVLCTSKNLADEHKRASYAIHTVLPVLEHRSTYPSKLAWIRSRMGHYFHRERLFLEWVGAEKPDVVHLQEWFPFTAAGLVRGLQEQGAKVVVSVHNIYRHEEFFPGHAWLQHLFERRAWKRSDRLIVMSPELSAELGRSTKKSLGEIDCVPHFVWPGGSIVAQDMIGLKRELRNVLLFGAIRRNKGVETFIDAMSGMPDYSGLIAGRCEDSDYAHSLEARIARSGGNVIFRNIFIQDQEIPRLFQEASLAVFPYSQFASQSGALYMAVANETPAVGTRVGALGSTIERYGLGLAVDPGDPTALAEALRAIHEPDSYLSAVDQAKRLKETQSILAIGAQLAEIYHQL